MAQAISRLPHNKAGSARIPGYSIWDLWKTKRHRNASLSNTLKRKTEREKEKRMKGSEGDK